MQPKVSMVMPCCNKQDYLGDMLESIENQLWDNIELILVNDGSTDGTRAVIAEWEPRLRKRGFEVIVIDQENAGVITAAKTGLERITGDYVCQIDADDELDPMYVSAMAGWLEKHPEHSFAVCDYIMYSWHGKRKVFYPFLPTSQEINYENDIEQFIVNHLFVSVWQYMVRTDYFVKCGVLENYTTASRASHEPGYILPLRAYGGKYKYFPLPLYRFCIGGNGMSQAKSFEHLEKYISEHSELCQAAISALPDSIMAHAQKQRLIKAADFTTLRYLYNFLDRYPDGPSQRERVTEALLAYVNSHFGKSYTMAQIAEKESGLIRAVSNVLSYKIHKEIASGYPGRIIAYGAKGKRGSRLIPQLRGTALEPTLLWDISADGDTTEIFGIPLEKPHFEDLRETDTILILPADTAIVTKVYESVKHAKLHDILFYNDIYDYVLHNVYFSGLDASENEK